jgi:hypothetical protein
VETKSSLPLQQLTSAYSKLACCFALKFIPSYHKIFFQGMQANHHFQRKKENKECKTNHNKDYSVVKTLQKALVKSRGFFVVVAMRLLRSPV